MALPAQYLGQDASVGEEEERSLGAVSSLSSENDDETTVPNGTTMDWYAVLQRTAQQRLKDLHGGGGLKGGESLVAEAHRRREAATPVIVAVVRPSREKEAATFEWTSGEGGGPAVDVRLGPGRLGAAWRRTFSVFAGVGLQGCGGPSGDATHSDAADALVDPLVAALCPGLGGALDGSLARGAATTVLAVGSAARNFCTCITLAVWSCPAKIFFGSSSKSFWLARSALNTSGNCSLYAVRI